MTVIGTNVSALRASNASMQADTALSTSMQRLSTGKRINSAKDDAAGLAISNSMTAQIRGMNQGVRNANDGISMAQTAEGALDEVGNMLQRMRELAVEGANGTYSTTDAANIKSEQDALATQINSVLKNTKFNGINLFDGSAGQVGTAATGTAQVGTAQVGTAQVGTAGSGTVGQPGYVAPSSDYQPASSDYQPASSDYQPASSDYHAASSDYVAGTGNVSIQAGANATDKVTLKLGGNLTTDAAITGIVQSTTTGGATTVGVKSTATLADYDTAINKISSTRANLGAAQNQLQSAVNNLTSNSTNLTAAQSRITDTDFSTESTALAKAQILSQASTAMLAQANQSQQNVLSLLK
jgi:flagellin